MAKGSPVKKGNSTQGLKVIQGMEYLSPESQKNLADRLARIEGHLRAIRNMVLQHRCADEILLQIAAVKGAINKVAGIIVDQEMKACVKVCMKGNTEERLEKTLKVLSTILNQT